MAGMTIRELVTKWGFDIDDDKLKQFNKDIDQTKKRLDDVGKKLTKVGKTMTLAISLPAIGLGAFFIKAVSDAEETVSKFNTVFSKMSDISEQTAKSLADNFGLSIVKSKELLGNTGDLLSGFGFSQKAALDLSKQVNELAVDLASFTNFSGGAAGASAALTKALLGERESIKSLGISILEEDVKRRVALNTSKGMRFETERQAKAFATLQLAQEQSKNAIGDFARTSSSFANRSRIFRARLQDLSIGFGNLLLPTATKTLNTIIELVEKINNLSAGTKKTILIIGGAAAVFGPLILIIGTFIRSLQAIVVGYRALTVAVTVYKNAQLLANIQALLLPGLIVAGILLVIAVIEDLVSFFRGNRSVTGVIVKSFGKIFTTLKAKFMTFFSSIIESIRGFISKWLGIFESNFPALFGFVKALAKFYIAVFKLVFLVIKSWVKGVVILLTGITKGFKAIFGFIATVVKDNLAFFKAVFQTMGSILLAPFIDLKNMVVAVFKFIEGLLKSQLFSTLIKGPTILIQGITGIINALASGSSLIDLIQSKLKQLPDIFGIILKGIINIFATPLKIIETAVNTLQGIGSFVKNLNPVKGLFGAISNKASDILPIFQPFVNATSPEISSTQGLGIAGSPPSSQNQNNLTNNVDVNAPITVQVPEGTPINEVGSRVETGVQNAIQNLLRTTLRANEPQIAF